MKAAPGETVELVVAGTGGVPATGVGAVVLNVTAVDATGPGFVTVWPNGQPRPTASNLNLGQVGQTIPNLVIVPVGTDGKVNIFTDSGTHLLADVAGWVTLDANATDPASLILAMAGEATLGGDEKAENATITYTGSSLVVPGKVFVLPPDDTHGEGFYGRVRSNVGLNTYLVEPLRVGDIVPAAAFSFDIPDPTTPATASVQRTNVAISGMRMMSSGLRFSKTQAIPCGSAKYDLSFDGTALFIRNVHLDSDWDFGWRGVTVKSVSLSAEVGVTLAMLAKLDAAASCSGSWRLLDLNYKSTFSIGPVPVWIDQTLTIDAKASIGATGTVNWQLSREFGSRVGVKYTKDNGFSPIREPLDHPNNSATFDATGSAHAEFHLPISYDARLYGITGLGATLEPWLTADVNAAANTTTASASVEVKLGVPLTVRGSLRFKAKLPVIGEFGWEKSYDFGRYDIIRERSIYSRSWTWSIAGSAPSPVNAVAPKPPTAPVVIPSGGTTYPIARTSGQGILLFNSPRVTDIKTSGPNDGARVTISCQVWGEPAGPYSNHVWDYIRWNGKEGFIPDTYVDSPTVADQFLVGAQRCADPGVVVQAPASAPVAQVFAATNSPSGATFVSSSPSLAATRRTGPSLGDHFVIICQAWGDPYGNFNNHVWDKITWAGSDGYLPDTYASTPVVADQFVSGIARCAGGDPPVVVTNPTVATHAEQQGHNGANTFSNTHTISGAGPRVSPGQIVNVSCKVLDTSAASISPDGYWYRLADSPWNNQYYAAANTFYNGDPINGPYTHNTDFSVPDCNPVVQPPPTPNPTLYPEQQGSRGANTFLDHHAISGQGVSVAPRQTVNVSCKVLDTSAASISPDGYWYRLADSPWNNQYYAAANTFYNGDPINGPYTHNTDFNVPNC